MDYGLTQDIIDVPHSMYKKVAQNFLIATSTLYSFLLQQPNNWWKMAYILCWVKYFLERKQKMFYGWEIQYKVRLYTPTSYKILNNPWGGCCHVVFSEYKLILLTDFHGLSQKLEGINISNIPSCSVNPQK